MLAMARVTRTPPRKRSTAQATRYSVSFSPNATEWLVTEATRRGIGVTEVIRRIIDEVRRDYILDDDR